MQDSCYQSTYCNRIKLSRCISEAIGCVASWFASACAENFSTDLNVKAAVKLNLLVEKIRVRIVKLLDHCFELKHLNKSC